jgi:hypothetical protein
MVSASFVDLDGNRINAGSPVQKKFTIESDATKQKTWWERLLPWNWEKWSPEARIEAMNLAFVLAIAIAGVFVAARDKIQSLEVFEAAGVLIGTGFALDMAKSLITKSGSN